MTDTPRPRTVVISHGFADLSNQNPITPGRVTPHLTFDAEDFRVRHLAFGTDAVLAEHVAPAPVVIIVVEGHVVFDIEGATHELAQGGIIHIDADVPHVVTALEPSRLILTLVGAR